VRPTDFAKQKPEVPLAMAKRVEVLKNVALIGGWQKEEEEEEEPFAFDPFITRFSRGRGKKRGRREKR
jgi:hypothetical protein